MKIILYPAAIAIWIGLLSTPFAFPNEKKLHVVLYCASSGRTEIMFFGELSEFEKFKNNQMKKNYDSVIEEWELSGRSGPKPLKPLPIKLKTCSQSEATGRAFTEYVDSVRKKNAKHVDERKKNFRERLAAKIGKGALDDAQERSAERSFYPESDAVRGLPERYTPMLWNPRALITYTGAIRFRWWMSASPAAGRPDDKKIRLVLELSAIFRAPADKFTSDVLKHIETRGNFVKEKKSEVQNFFEYRDAYVLEIATDGAWREYVLPVEWEIWRAIGAEVHHNEVCLTFAAADPGIFYFDDVSVEGDEARMPDGDIENIYLEIVRKLKIERDGAQGKAETDGLSSAYRSILRMNTGIPVGEVTNGGFDAVFDDFVRIWQRRESDAIAGGTGKDPGVTVERVAGRRGQSVPNGERAETRRVNDKKDEANDARFYVKCDASRLKPDDLGTPVSDVVSARGTDKKGRDRAAADQLAGTEMLSRSNEVKNGTFSDMSDDWFGEWQRSGPGQKVARDGANTWLLLEKNDDGDKFPTVSQKIKVPEGAGKIKISFRVKLNDVKPGKTEWFVARVVVVYEDVDGKALGKPVSYGGGGTHEWESVAEVYDVPENASGLKISLRLFGRGSVEIDDLEAYFYKRRD